MIVSLSHLRRSFGETEAVRDVSLTIAPGEMFGFIGPDGAGKTTTLKMIAGLLSPGAGDVSTCGLDPRRGRKDLSRRVGYLFPNRRRPARSRRERRCR